ncbi:CD1107 family mobile element protein [Lysinibacillus xylanilyticus]|uniref:CD1107 family mobile element protein n=1 Tax=Lysinibacillus xylanilyticus TaxID=582475 RepID=UPI003D06844A
MGTTIKRVFLTTVLLCSLLYISLPNPAFAEDKKGGEPTTEKVNVVNNGDVAEPPSGPNTTIDTEVKEVEIDTPASVTGKKVEGTGTVTDFSTSGSKAFYTITDRDQNVFYLIVDLDKTDNNVYFLSDVNKSQLEGSREPTENVQVAPVVPPTEEKEQPKESGNGSFLLMVLLVAVIIVVVYYFRMTKKKKEQGNAADEDEMTEDYEEDDMLYEEDDKDYKDNK